jgi:hypothetical protein
MKKVVVGILLLGLLSCSASLNEICANSGAKVWTIINEACHSYCKNQGSKMEIWMATKWADEEKPISTCMCKNDQAIDIETDGSLENRYIIRHYHKNGNKHWEYEYQNGQPIK